MSWKLAMATARRVLGVKRGTRAGLECGERLWWVPETGRNLCKLAVGRTPADCWMPVGSRNYASLATGFGGVP